MLLSILDKRYITKNTKNGQFTTINVSFRDRRIFDMSLERAKKNLIQMLQKVVFAKMSFKPFDIIAIDIIIIIIISLLMSPLLGHRPSLWITRKENGP
jgi:hypothetical protein